jgi:hypothetical protein
VCKEIEQASRQKTNRKTLALFPSGKGVVLWITPFPLLEAVSKLFDDSILAIFAKNS